MVEPMHGLADKREGSIPILSGQSHLLENKGNYKCASFDKPSEWCSGQNQCAIQCALESNGMLGSHHGLNVNLAPLSPTSQPQLQSPFQSVETDAIQLKSPVHTVGNGVHAAAPGNVPFNVMLGVHSHAPETVMPTSSNDRSPATSIGEQMASLLDEVLTTAAELRFNFQKGNYNASSEHIHHLGYLVNVAGALHNTVSTPLSGTPSQETSVQQHGSTLVSPEISRKRRSECIPELTPLKAARGDGIVLGSPLATTSSETMDNTSRSHVFPQTPSQLGGFGVPQSDHGMLQPIGELGENMVPQMTMDGIPMTHMQPKSPAKLFGPHVLESVQGVTPLTGSETADKLSPTQATVRSRGDSAVESLDDDTWESFGMLDKTNGATDLPLELRVRLETIFHEFLNNLCSNLDATDERGEPIHQTLMPKKMARLDESPDFRPFKFRIQAFTNAFQAAAIRAGLGDDECSIKRIKQFLWTQPYISRFNEDGKKAKSKGNHIWNIEAKKLPDGQWEFRAFTPRITGETSKVAYVNEEWTWHLRVWDPQAASNSIKVVYSINSLPSWIRWDDAAKVLTGIPESTSQGGEVSVTGLYVHLGQLHRLEHSFFLEVRPPRSELNGAVHLQKPQECVIGEVPNSTTQQINLENAAAYLLPQSNAALLPSSAAQPAISSQNSLHTPQLQNKGHSNGIIPALDVPHVAASHDNGELQKHEVVEPALASQILSSISFPFTPPVYTDKYQPRMSVDQAMMATIPRSRSNSLAQSNEQISPEYLDIRHNPHVDASNSPVGQHLMGMVGPHLTDPALLHSIEQRQKAQMSSFMLTIPERRQGFVLSDHAGNTTPISSMPGDISASLPQSNA